jgi:hypothetical protein
MQLALHAIGTLLPAVATHSNLLGTVVPSAYRHLYDPAGNRSRPPTVRRGSTMLYSPSYRATAAGKDERCSDLASQAVGRTLAAARLPAERVQVALHAQCTLDQQILGSTCLRIEHDHFREARTTMTIGQLGTAGLPVVFKLAALALSDAPSEALACVSASDKWIAPFFRRVTGLVTYGDAAAACLVGDAEHAVKPVAVVESVQTSCRPPAHDLWTASADEQRQALLEHATAVIGDLAGITMRDRDTLVLAGDGYGEEFSRRLAEATGIRGGRLNGLEPESHLSCAAPLFATASVIEAAVREGRWLRAVVWTASPAGHAGALLIRCAPDARRFSDGWTSAESGSTPVSSTPGQPTRSLETTS